MAQPTNNNQIEIKQLSVVLKRRKILSDITISFAGPGIYGIVGPNGTGKSVLLKTILGFIRPQQGTVAINQVVIDPRRPFPAKIGAVIEHPGFIEDMSGYDNLMALGRIRSQLSHDEVVNVLKRVGLAADKKPVASYSLGMIQRLGIAQAIMEDQEFIVLDEPTNALDREGIVFLTELLKELRDQGKLVLIATHDLMWLQSLADQIFELSNGKLQQVEDVV